MRQEITEALSYALNKGIQIHPNALVVLEDADATNLMRVMREIIINKTRQHNSLITKDDVEAALGIKETTDVVATFDVLFDPSPNVASAKKYKVNVTSETIKEAFANDQVLEDIL